MRTTFLVFLVMFTILVNVGCSKVGFNPSGKTDPVDKSITDDSEAGASSSLDDSSAEDGDDELSDADAIVTCEAFRVRASALPSAATFSGDHIRESLTEISADAVSISDIRGSLNAISANLRLSDHRHGAVCLIGRGTAAVAEVDNHRGYLEISNLALRIENTRNTLVIRDSHVTSLVNHRGLIRLINTTVDQMTNVRGEIVLEGDSSITAKTDVSTE